MTKRAVLIGCNYSAIQGLQLRGCINDIVNVRNMLVDAYGYLVENVQILRDDGVGSLPTRANILAALKTLVEQSAEGDEIWIHYSGHGTQVTDKSANPDEPNDEAIVPCDYKTAGYIVDDEIFDIIKSLVATAIIVFDSCHSGTVVDLEYTTNYNNGTLSTVTNNNKTMTNPNVFMFSGCRDSQTSSDAFSNFEQEAVGAFTNSFLETLRANRHNASITKVYLELCANLSKNGFSQIPCLSSSASTLNYTFQQPSVPSSVQPLVQQPFVQQPFVQQPFVQQPFVQQPFVQNPVVITKPPPPPKPQSTPYVVTAKPKPQPQVPVFYKVKNNSTSQLSQPPIHMLKQIQ